MTRLSAPAFLEFMHVMSSSLRECSLEQTLERARQLARRFQITRVTDTTRLDRLGIPVFASIRPDAVANSLCVNAGKGLRAEEAQVGAYMEAIEFAFAEPRHSTHSLFPIAAKALESHSAVRYRLIDLCPRWGVRVEPEETIFCVNARDEETGESVPVPAETVFHPFSNNPGRRIFGTTTNGLASGNSAREAMVHGLCETIERHVHSFHNVKNQTYRVDVDQPEPTIAPLLDKVREAGLRFVLRYAAGPGRLPFFNAFLLEHSDDSTISITQGMGLHPRKEIAAVRAITEAAQSRLTFIHGGRDDITHWIEAPSCAEFRLRVAANERSRAAIEEDSRRLAYSRIPDCRDGVHSIESAWETLRSAVLPDLAKQILTVELTQPSDPISVIKVIVPGLECYEPVLKRVGPRLMQYVDAL